MSVRGAGSDREESSDVGMSIENVLLDFHLVPT